MPEQQQAARATSYDDGDVVAGAIIPTSASPNMVSVREEIGQLLGSIKSLHESPNHVSFWMSVDTTTAKASLVPIPTYDNIQKLQSATAQPE